MVFHVFAHFIDKNNGFQVFDALKNPTGVKYAPIPEGQQSGKVGFSPEIAFSDHTWTPLKIW